MRQEESTNTQVFAMASAIGIVAGMRSLTAPAIVGQIARSGSIGRDRSRFGLFGNPLFAKVLIGLAASEAIADKLPGIPKRTSTFPLIARIISGAICGATLCSVKDESPFVGAVAGTLGAIGSTFAVYELRRQASQSLGLPDAAIALIEDATAVWIGTAISSTLAPKQIEA